MPQVNTYAGESAALFHRLTFKGVNGDRVAFSINDPQGVLITDSFSVVKNGDGYDALFNTKPGLAAGTYTGNFELKVCFDAAEACTQPVPGSPLKVAYKLIVSAGNSQPELKKLAGAAPWTTLQGNLQHQGRLAAAVNSEQFSRRWVSRAYGRDSSPGFVVAAGQSLFVVNSGDIGGGGTLSRGNESDGKLVWQYDQGGVFAPQFSAPALDGNRVWATARSGVSGATWLLGINATTGATEVKSSIASDFATPHVSVTDTGLLIAQPGNEVPIKFSRSGIELWTANIPTAQQFEVRGWSATSWNGMAISYDPDRVWLFNDSTGALEGSIETGTVSNVKRIGWMRGLPVLDSTGRAFIRILSRLQAFDLSARKRLWTSSSYDVASDPVVVDNQVLVLSGEGVLSALDAATGRELWTWAAPRRYQVADQYVGEQLVVVGSTVFLAVDRTTYAVDLASHKAVWKYDSAGSMAVTENGVLVIYDPYAPDGATTTAFNLH